MALPYRHVLLIGASSGIGRGMAERLIEGGSKVIVVGRRKDRLDALVEKYGKDKVTSTAFDISKRDEIPQFVKEVTTSHPDLDCVFLNAGIQSPISFGDPSKLDISAFLHECDVNFSSLVALTYGFLPFLMTKQEPTGFIFTGANIAIVPAAGLPAYSASKAALNAFILCLRE
ncbi:hypothetical protein BP5796_01151 [Coleophoma crateriformis]|uniref:Uncharacterized protein n=1 Tax=Coleophoma crateriformis TaxID=565419 RepID=A0A3D8SZK7_9HELO|nr:hypothetical protein BP5796_01151 [Coleophoma crateriformis]